MSYIESLPQSAYWQVEVIKYGPEALTAPRILGNIVTKRANFNTSRFVPARQYADELRILNPNPTAAQTAAEKVRQDFLLQEQAKADHLNAEQTLYWLTKRWRKHHMLDRYDKAELAFHAAGIANAKADADPGKDESQLTSSYELFDALRESQYPFIRAQAWLGMGTHPYGGTWRRRRVYLAAKGRGAMAQAFELQREHPGDADIDRLSRDIADAIEANKAEEAAELAAQQNQNPPTV